MEKKQQRGHEKENHFPKIAKTNLLLLYIIAWHKFFIIIHVS